jgi:hypothetical protein
MAPSTVLTSANGRRATPAAPDAVPVRAGRLRARSVMVSAGDVWMQAGLSAAVREVAPAALCHPDDTPPVPLSALVVWLPALQEGLPEAVRRLAGQLSLCGEGATVLLLAREVPGWLYRTLNNLIPQRRALLCRVLCLPDRIAPHRLQMALRGRAVEEAVLLRDAGPEPCQPGLSGPELQALGATLRGEDIHAMAHRADSPVVVQHRLRWQAMQKVGGLRVKNLLHPFRPRRGT